MGSGIYVCARQAARERRVTAEAPLETIRARQLIESELAAHAALHMKKAQIAGLRDAVAQMEAEIAEGRLATAGDRLFHVRIAEACDNSVLLRIVTELHDERHNPLFEQFGNHFENAKSWMIAVGEHRAVVDAIASRSPETARAAMSHHLHNSHARFTASWTNDPSDAAIVRRVTARKTA